jgi:hypothetical protein
MSNIKSSIEQTKILASQIKEQVVQERRKIESKYILNGLFLGLITFAISVIIPDPVSGLMENISAGFFGATFFFLIVERTHQTQMETNRNVETINYNQFKLIQEQEEILVIMRSGNRRNKIMDKLIEAVLEGKNNNRHQILQSLIQVYKGHYSEQALLVQLIDNQVGYLQDLLSASSKVDELRPQISDYKKTLDAHKLEYSQQLESLQSMKVTISRLEEVLANTKDEIDM